MIEDLGDIVVVAPDSPRSGQSSALSVGIPLRLNLIEHYRNISFYRTNGTPVDCVKLSMNQLFDRRPDLLLSGINHGSNSGVSIVYSGTMGAALEGCIIGIPSIGFSLTSHEPDADFSPCREIVRESCKKVLKKGLPLTAPDHLGSLHRIPAAAGIAQNQQHNVNIIPDFSPTLISILCNMYILTFYFLLFLQN